MEAKCPEPKMSGHTTENVEEYQEIIGELTNLLHITAQRDSTQMNTAPNASGPDFCVR